MITILLIYKHKFLTINVANFEDFQYRHIPQQNLETNSFFECHIKITFHSEYIVLDTRGCREYSNHTFRLFKRADFFFKLWRVAMNECVENTRPHRFLKRKIIGISNIYNYIALSLVFILLNISYSKINRDNLCQYGFGLSFVS